MACDFKAHQGHANEEGNTLLFDQAHHLDRIPFGHDDGSNTGNKYSNMLDNYKTGGTPWHIIIDKDGIVVFDGFEIEAQQAVRVLEAALGTGN